MSQFCVLQSGMENSEKLGQLIKNRYIGLVSEEYVIKEVRTYFTNHMTCIRSFRRYSDLSRQKGQAL